MKLEPRMLPRIALGAGILGFVLRLGLSLAGTDQNGLMPSAHPSTILLLLLTSTVLFVIGFSIKPITTQPPYGKLFPGMPDQIGHYVAAAGVLISCFFQNATAIGILTGLAATACFVLIGNPQLNKLVPRRFSLAAITGYLALYLLQQYRHWNTEPQILHYFFPMLALVFLMIATYYKTAADTEKVNLRALTFFHCGGIFFSCVGMASNQWIFFLGMTAWLITWDCNYTAKRETLPMILPEEVLYCIETLEEAGHRAYVVGGCVRDHLLGLTPHDYDMCTDATPEQICQLFSQHECIRNGEKHGTIGVVLAGTLYEITTFRKEGTYTDSRHPDWVEFVTDIKEDLARRDFTINAMAYSPTEGYIDPFGGQQDLQNQILKTVGDAQTRFQEDALRVLRGVRFGVRFGLMPETETLAAMNECAPLLDNIAQERIFSELSKLLLLIKAADLLRYSRIITQVIPELAPTVDFQQNSPHHAYDVYTHTAYVVEATPADLTLRFAALLHDAGKPSTYTTDETGRGHFYGHAEASSKIADAALLRLKAPTALRTQAVLLIQQHMTPFVPDKKALRRRLSKLGDETIEQLLALQRADFCAKGVNTQEDPGFNLIDALLAEIRLDGSCLAIKDLAVSGTDLLALGVQPGPHIGECMKLLLSLVQDEILENDKQDLLNAAKSFFETEQE